MTSLRESESAQKTTPMTSKTRPSDKIATWRTADEMRACNGQVPNTLQGSAKPREIIPEKENKRGDKFHLEKSKTSERC